MPGDNPRYAGEAVSGGHDDSRQIAERGSMVSRPRLRRLRAALSASAFSGLTVSAHGAPAQQADVFGIPGLSVGTFEVIQFAVFTGVLGAALLSALWLIRERARTAAENASLRAKVSDLNASLSRTESLLNLRDQRVVVWTSDKSKPELVGALPSESGAPDERAAFLAFGRWLSPRSASVLENAIAALREKGTPFDRVIESQNGAPLEVRGRKTPGHAIVRFVSLSETQRAEARLRLENQRLSADWENLLSMADALAMPFWVRSADGRLKWVNRAYAQAVEAESSEAAVRDGKELLGTQAREAIARHHQSEQLLQQTVSTVVHGDRKLFTVTDFASPSGAAGLALDVSSMEAMREDYAQMMRNQADTLDQLTTAVAQFDADQKLRFYNNAFQKLWELDIAFLNSSPDNALLLDRLRGDGKIAEQPEWRRWKDNLLSVYRSVDSAEHWWHLPDSRTIRVIANPQPKGGVTWVFENLTEKFALESRYNTAIRVQSETLDSLTEGVAVFGPDGRMRLANPAFFRLWSLTPGSATNETHIAALRTACDDKAIDSPWHGFVAAVTGFDDERRDRQGQAELKNGTVLRYALIHLPNGQVMLTFIDVTDSVNVERALQDKNEALQKADQLKNDFVQRVSYELRSPLTNIIGFTELLDAGATGPLTERQKEYVRHIFSSSSVLLTLVNDILDLATVDAGIMRLEVGEVRITQVIASAAEMVSDRFSEHRIGLSVDVGGAPKSMVGDENRIRQVLANLLSNAANYAPEGSTVSLACREVANGMEFAVSDEGPGMPPEVLDIAFRRFETRANGGRRRGAGLGLSIVKSFVELHGGSVRIESGQEQGTTVVCFFPREPKQMQDAAE
ncbi:PAS domain-containing sensor histidine kinase [Arvimicrobium flavum]|uniref:PAS domain-containing sensor histidine kinase n=1 Tax=Arvimicrobium flavum TaxID=3393320 RepID=UPI00237AE87B|nr:PAS domain-containing sensor histidine kinase [Mesorhizobium shangrilense]